jgi:tetratricopeptide (TPR) repeat protein
MAASEIEKLERLVRENPKGRLFASLADAYRKDNQFGKALEVLEAGLQVHPDYVSARVVLGRVHMATGDNAAAKVAFSRVVELDGESVIALKALADISETDGDPASALKWAQQLLVVDPGNEETQKQVDRLAAAAPAPPVETAGAPAPEEARLSGIVMVEMDSPADVERTAAPFEAVKPPIAKTKEIPAISITPPAATTAPAFVAIPEPLDNAPEPLPLSDEAQVEKTKELVRPQLGLEPTAFDGDAAGAPTERLAGLDPQGLSPEEIASIGAASGFEPTSPDIDTRSTSRDSMPGLQSVSLEAEANTPTEDTLLGIEQETEIEMGASIGNEYQVSSAAETLGTTGSGSHEFQESSAAETLELSSASNEYQVASDADQLSSDAAGMGDAIDTGGTDIAFIEPEVVPPAYSPPPQAPVFTPAPMVAEEPEPAVAEPEPVVTEAMAELYASQGHFAEALEVYRQLAERDPHETRYADRMFELEMFAGGTAATESAPVEPEMEIPAPPPMKPGWDARMTGGVAVGSWLADVFSQALPASEAPAPEAPAPAPPAPAPIDALPLIMPPDEAPLPLIMPDEPIRSPAAAASAATPAESAEAPSSGKPTRPASGSFNLTNVFGEERPGAPVAQSGSFDDFFGAPAGASTPTPGAPASPSIRTSKSAPEAPPEGDDIAHFQDWLKGLKK